MVNDAIPFYEDGDELTATVVGSAVGGKTFVKIVGDLQADGTFSVSPAGAGDLVFGVAMWDAAVGKRVTVHTIEAGHVMPVIAGANIAANAPVKVGAGGQAITAAGGDKAIGICLSSAASGADAMIMTSRFTA